MILAVRGDKKIATYQKIKSDQRSLILKLSDRLANVQFSLVNNQKFFKMYQNQHKEFSEYLRSMTTHRMSIKLWQMLDNVI